MSDFHLHLLLWCTISVADDGDNTAQLHPGNRGAVLSLINTFSRSFNQRMNEAYGTYMVPEVVGTMGMSSASMGMDQGMWN